MRCMMAKKMWLIITVFAIGLFILIAATNPDTESLEINRNATVSLSGTVVDSTTREGVPQAQVILEEEGESTSTDEYGSFSFSNVETGNHTISVNAVNYRAAQERVEVTEEGATIEIQLDPDYK